MKQILAKGGAVHENSTGGKKKKNAYDQTLEVARIAEVEDFVLLWPVHRWL